MVLAPPRPMSPPLNALRAFEAAARLGGFKKAADELCVTPGAVAQHVKALEAWVGVPLFARRTHGVKLTPLGAGVLDDFISAFDGLGVAVQRLRSKASPEHVRIAALPSVAQLWLSPRLPGIREAAPEISVSITAMENPPNLRRDPFDLSIFFANEKPQETKAIVASDTIFPVCAPSVAARLGNLMDLENEVCLHDASWSDDWQHWLKAAGLGGPIVSGGPVFSLYSLAVEEARNGAGVLIGHEPLVRGLLQSGELVAPFDVCVTLDRSLVISSSKTGTDSYAISQVIEALC
jgi:DNA-binding transcriptional LysR family regulator